MKNPTMDNDSIVKKEVLGFHGILREAFRILTKNPKFLVFTLLTSFPLLLSLLLFEFVLQDTLLGSLRTLLSDDYSSDTTFCDGEICVMSGSSWGPMSSVMRVISNHFHQFALLGFVYLFVIHPLDLLNTVLIMCHSSALYAGEALPSFRGFLRRPLKEFGLGGPLVTSLYVLGLRGLVAVGLTSLGIQFWQFVPTSEVGTRILVDLSYEFYPSWDEVVAVLLSSLLFGGLFLVILMKSIEWSSIWNVGVALSVLEGKHGDVAIGVAAYISRGSRMRGFLLMLVFFMWQLCLRSLCLYFVWGGAGAGATIFAQALGVCLANPIKWAVVMVYYCDCKKRFLEKKIDIEDGKSTEHK